MERILDPQTFCQVGVIVRDIEAALDRYCRIFGCERPAVIITDEPEKARAVYRGAPTDARAKLAFLRIGSVSLELIEPQGGASTWQEFLDQHGEGVHHLAFGVKASDAVAAQFAAAGMPVAQQGHYEGGMYTYIDGEKSLGLILELLEDF